jgi:ApaG protein
MITEITQGVKISVETCYRQDISSPINGEHVFAYRITIENESEHSVKLLRRHWYIFDSNGDYREVEGEGVIGKKPVIEPMDYHQYASGCNLQTEIGKMHGVYQMERIIDGKLFDVIIPEFELLAPMKLN